MHCVSNYPCPLEDLNLNMIPVLKKKFKCEIGYSGHESHVSPSIMAYFLGARYIERHITLDRSMWGTDQAASLAENGMRTLSNILNKTNKVLGDGIKKITKREKELIKSLDIGINMTNLENIKKSFYSNGFVHVEKLFSRDEIRQV